MEPIIDIYKELNIPRFSDEAVIKNGLRKVTIEFHPDNHVNDPVEVQKELAERLGLLSQICNYLYVPEQKDFYDDYLKKSDEVENKKDFKTLMSERCDLEVKLLKRKFELLSAFMSSSTYLSLVAEEQRISSEILGCARKRRDLNNKIKIVSDSRVVVYLSSIDFEMPNVSFVDTSQYDNQLDGLNKQLSLLKLKIDELHKELEIVQNKISNFQVLDFCLKDDEYIKISAAIEEIKLKMESLRSKNI